MTLKETMDDELKFRIKKLPTTYDEDGEVVRTCEWLLFMGDTLIYHDRDVQECLKLATYVIDMYGDPEDFEQPTRGLTVRTFDLVLLAVGLTGAVVWTILGYYLVAAVFVLPVIIAGRGLLLQDYYHLDRRTLKDLMGKFGK